MQTWGSDGLEVPLMQVFPGVRGKHSTHVNVVVLLIVMYVVYLARSEVVCCGVRGPSLSVLVAGLHAVGTATDLARCTFAHH